MGRIESQGVIVQLINTFYDGVTIASTYGQQLHSYTYLDLTSHLLVTKI